MKKRILIAAIDIVTALSMVFIYFFSRFMLKNFPPCYFAERGFLCPACGGTRCVAALCSGNIIEAFKYNAMFFLMFLYIGAFIVFLNIAFISGSAFFDKAWRKMINPYILIAWAIGFAVFGILRNFV